MSKLIEVLQKMPGIEKAQCPYDAKNIKTMLDNGQTIICADSIGGNIAIKYAFTIIDSIFYTFKLSDSTDSEIVLTLEQAAKMTPKFFSLIFESYLQDRDFLIIDQDNLLGDAQSYFGDFSHAKIRKCLTESSKDKVILVFSDPLSPIDLSTLKK